MGIALSRRKTTPTPPRLDRDAIKARLDVAAVATALFGPAPKQAGRTLAWCCPFHDDHDPSLQVDPVHQHWKCWPCDLGGDAIALIMQVRKLAFPDALAAAAEMVGIGIGIGVSDSVGAGAGAATSTVAARAAGLTRDQAERTVNEAARRIWEPEGRQALAYLQGRGLSAETIRAHRLGWADDIRMPRRDGAGNGTWRLAGVVIPWLDSGRLVRVRVRRLEPEEANANRKSSRYLEVFTSSWRVYPGPAAIRPGLPLAVCEGELDALLLGQALVGLAGVATFGSSSSRADPSLWVAIARCSGTFAALDADTAGDRAAAEWDGRSMRVRPPAGKDWTESVRAGIDLRRWWLEDHFPAGFDREERAAIMEFDGGLARSEAESKAKAGILGRIH